MATDISVGMIVVNYRTPDLTIDCIDAIAAARRECRQLRLVVVDGASEDGSAERIARTVAERGYDAWVRTLPLPVNGGFGYANNAGLACLTEWGGAPDAVCLINPDALVKPGALTALLDRLRADDRTGAVGARLVHHDGRIQGSAFTWPTVKSEFVRGSGTGFLAKLLRTPPVAYDTDDACRVDWVTGAAVIFSMDAIRRTGFFDDGFFLYFEETELMHRLERAGFAIWHEPAAEIVHLAGASTQNRDPATGRLLEKRVAPYWYRSRLRYFALTGGRRKALAAGLAFLAGRLVWRLRQLLPGGRRGDVPSVVRDTIAYSLWPSRADLEPSICWPDRRLPAMPAWMTRDRGTVPNEGAGRRHD